jgi:cyclic pyranopterin phosphate synthase
MAMQDAFHRSIEYLRLSVTDRCDLRCHYCIPKGFTGFEEPAHWLNFTEMERLIGLFTQLGVRAVRLTGGEPLLRHNLPDLAKRLAPRVDLSLSTNGVRLNRQAAALRRAGVRRINVSLDSLRADRFQGITGGKLRKMLDGLRAARDAGFHPIKINMVVMRDINDDEVDAMLEFCLTRGYTLRYIEIMPMGDTGRLAGRHYVSLQTVKQQLARHYELIPALPVPGSEDMGPARYFHVAGSDARVGFITPISEHFCATCNRVRLAADGTLYPCLGQNNAVALGRLMRDGMSDAELLDIIRKTIFEKPERHEFTDKPEKIIRFMSVTGG